MTLLNVLRQCKERNIVLAEDNGRLVIHAPDGVLDAQLSAALRSLEEQFLAMFSEKKRMSSAPAAPQAPSRLEEEAIPLSEYQLPVWAAYEQKDQHAAILALAESFELDRRISAQDLRSAFRWIVGRHSMLRARFSVCPDLRVTQRILAEVPVVVTQTVLTEENGNRDEAARDMLSSVIAVPYDLERDVLFRVGLVNDEFRNSIVLIGIAHIIGDVASLRVILQDLERYLDYLDGARALPDGQPAQYPDYLRMLEKRFSGSEEKRDLTFWRSQLQHLPPVHGLPTDYCRPVNREAPTFDSITLRLASAAGTEAMAQDKSISLFVYLLTALRTTLYRFGGECEIPLITPMANRHRHSELEGAVGCFANEVVVNIPLDEKASLGQALFATRSHLAAIMDRQEFPFSRILRHFCPSRTSDWLPIAQIFFSFLDYSGTRRAKHRFESLRGMEYDLSFLLVRDRDGLNLVLGFDSSLFKKTTVLLIADLFRRCCDSLAKYSERTPVSLPLDAASHSWLTGKTGGTAEYAEGVAESTEDVADVKDSPSDPLAEVLRLNGGRTAVFLQGEQSPILDRLRDRLTEAGVVCRTHEDGLLFNMSSEVMLFTSCSKERMDSILSGTDQAALRLCIVNHLPSASILRHAGAWRGEGCLLLEMPRCPGAATNVWAFVSFSELRLLQGGERFIPALVSPGLNFFSPGERTDFGQGLEGIQLSDGKIALPLPDPAVAHVWREGVSLDLDTLAAEHSRVTGRAVALGLVPPFLSGDTTDTLVEWVADGGTHLFESRASSRSGLPQPDIRADIQVRLAAIPLTPKGTIDRQALSHLPLLSETLLPKLEENLTVSGFEKATLRLGKAVAADRYLHHSDLFPETDAVSVAGRYSALEIGRVSQTDGLSENFSEAHGADLPGGLSLSFREYMERFDDTELFFIGISGEVTKIQGSFFRERAVGLLGALQRRGLSSGSRVILYCAREEELLSLAWACLLGGICMTALMPPMLGQNPEPLHARLGHMYALLGKPPVLTARDHELPFVPEQCHFYNDLVEESKEIRLPPVLQTTRPDTLTYIAFTSGSTGTPKGVPLTAANVFSMIHAKDMALGTTEEETVLSMTALDHVASLFGHSFLATVRRARQVYCSFQYVLADPLRILDSIDTYRVAQTWAPDFTWRHLHESLRRQGGEGRQWNLACVRHIISGGESTREATFSNLQRSLSPYHLPDKVFLHSWGMSETSSFFTLSDAWDGHAQISHLGIIDAGRPLSGSAIRVTDAQGNVLPEGSIGSLQVRSPAVFSAYLDNPEANAKSFTKDGWFITGDLAIIRGGKMVLCGREKEQVVIQGQNISQFDIEGMVDGIDGVEPTFSVVIGCKNENTNDDDVLIFARTQLASPEQRRALIRRINAEVSSHYGVMPRHVLLVDEHSVPKAALGKIQRTRILKKFISGGFGKELRETDLLLRGNGTVPDWFAAKRWMPAHFPNPGRTQFVDLAVEGAFFVAGSATPLATGVTDALMAHGVAVCRVNAEPTGECHTTLCRALDEQGADSPAGTVLVFIEPEKRGTSRGEPDALWIERSFMPLYRLMAALAQNTHRVRELVVITSGGQAIRRHQTGGEWSAALAGLTSSLPRATGIRTRLVDIEGESTAVDVDSVLAEIRFGGPEEISAWRGGQRFVPLLQRISFASEQAVPAWDTPFGASSFCLCTGMTGNLGRVLLPQLLLKTKGNFLLLGRSGEADAENVLADICGNVPGWDRRVLYLQADIADYTSILHALEQAKRGFSANGRQSTVPGGVLHLAANTGERDFLNLTAEELVDALRTRARHMTAIERAFNKGGGTGPRIVFSSVVSLWGGAGSSQYAPSCALVEALTHNHNASPNVREENLWHCLAWSRWLSVAGADDVVGKLMEKRGFRPISPEQGLLSMLAMLRQSVASRGELYFAGLDTAIPDVSGRFRFPGHAVPVSHTLELISAAESSSSIRRQCEKWLGRGLPVRMSTPHADDSATPRASAAEVFSEERSRTERRMSAIWRDILQLTHIDPTENFFELGGTSLHVPQLRKKIQEVFSVDVGSIAFFHYPCLREMSQHVAKTITQYHEAETGNNPVVDRARMQRKARALRR